MKTKDIKVNETYNGVKILLDLGYSNNSRKYLCVCPDCGENFVITSHSVGITRACKKCSKKYAYKDITNNRYGRLVAVKLLGREKGQTKWICKCDCGNTAIVSQGKLGKNTFSCGCLKRETSLLGGNKRKSARVNFGRIRNHPLYNIWITMKSRCYNTHSVSYKKYGERGIKVCERWLGECGFENFVNDMGERPSKNYSIDRINVDGDYCPENCRWATYTEQNRNRRNTLYVYLNGEKVPLSEVCKEYGIPYSKARILFKKNFEMLDIINKYKK